MSRALETGKVCEAAGALRRGGDLAGARDLLVSADAWHDPQLVVLAVLTLDNLEDSAGLQNCLARAIAALPTVGVLSDEYLIFLHRRAEQYCLSEAARFPLLDRMEVRGASQSDEPAGLRRVLAAGRQRRAFGAAFRARWKTPHFVPLGLNCMPWVLSNRWGLHDPQTYCRNLGPFAMAVHTIPGVIAALATDFETYAAADEIMTIAAPGGRPVVMRKDRGATWVHHDNAYFFRDDYANLRTAMQERAACMRAASRVGTPVFMMNFVNVRFPDQPLRFLPALRNGLEKFTGRGDHFIFMSNTIHAHEGEQVHDVDERTCFFYCTAPEKGFKWNQDANLESDASMVFERTYLERMQTCLERWGIA